jgi:hypothetical protein
MLKHNLLSYNTPMTRRFQFSLRALMAAAIATCLALGAGHLLKSC